MKDKVLIDTSAWIDYFQDKKSTVSDLIDEILTHKDVYVPKIVIAELIQGARSEKEVSVIKKIINAFTIIAEGKETWYKAGKLSFDLKRKGKTINLADCYIAAMASEHGCSVLTLDKHFIEIQKHEGLKLVEA